MQQKYSDHSANLFKTLNLCMISTNTRLFLIKKVKLMKSIVYESIQVENFISTTQLFSSVNLCNIQAIGECSSSIIVVSYR